MFISQARVRLIYIRSRFRSVILSAVSSRGAGGKKGFPGKTRGALNSRVLCEARVSLCPRQGSEEGCRHGACRSTSALAAHSGTGRPTQPQAKGDSDGKAGAGKDTAAETWQQVKYALQSGVTSAWRYHTGGWFVAAIKHIFYLFLSGFAPPFTRRGMVLVRREKS